MSHPSYDDRLEHLLDTAAQVFADKGFHATTMRDLSRATGMSLAGMYYYVRRKDELLFLIERRCFTAVLDGAEAAIRLGTDPADRIARFIRHHVTFFAEHMSEMKVLTHEAESLDADGLTEINALKRRYLELLRQLIDDVSSEGERRCDPRIAAYALFGSMNWIYTWYSPTGSVSPVQLAEQFAGLFLHGLLTPTPSSLPHGG